MFVTFMSFHVLLCVEVLPYIVLRVEVFRSLNFNLNLNRRGLEFIRSRGLG
jgi:hypothetical protein